VKITVIGSTGQFGTDLMEILGQEHEVIGLSHQDIEIADFSSCLVLKQIRPEVIISTAAFHKTDECEKKPLETFSVNALGARNIAMISKEIDSTVVFISTDYVFDGSKNDSYTEEDTPCPLNTYGISKLAAEFFIRQNPKFYIIRIASVFGVAGASGKGGNFVETMIKKAKNNETISVVDNIWMSPTYTKDAALIIKGILEYNLPFGIYHATNKGYCSWYEFAKEIFRILDLNPILKPIKADPNYGLAKRPRFSALRSTKLSDYELESRKWKEALYAYLIEKGHI
jgi:dTDP-4-dehydrorhamnose reductase